MRPNRLKVFKSESKSYAELVQLYENKDLPEALQVKLDRPLTTPFISNAASARGVQPLLPTSKLGTFVRVVQWNIEEGMEYGAISAALSDPRRFAKLRDSAAYPRGSQERKKILKQVVLMTQANVIVLQWKTTQYGRAVQDSETIPGPACDVSKQRSKNLTKSSDMNTNPQYHRAGRSSFSLAQSAHDDNGAMRVHSNRFGYAPQ
jgi:hypothetical protein